MNGVLVLDKPEGKTSFDVVAEVRRRLKVKKAGHTGTLDPFATGLLPICLGEATRLAGLITEGDKSYEATVRLGASTDTQDLTGKVLAEAPVPTLTREQIEQALERFRGEIDQAPPMFSAVKVDGKRLYELARRGEQVERVTRKVVVHRLELLELALPELKLAVRCSKGTYVRTLGHDLGEALGCHAHLTALRRVESAGFRLEQAITLRELAEDPAAAATRLISPRDALASLPEVVVEQATAARIAQGQRLPGSMLPPPQEGQRLRLSSAAGDLLAVGEWREGTLRYLCVLVRPEAAAGAS